MELKDQKGVTIIEAIVAAVIVGIGFVAVYGLTTASTRTLLSSIDREKANMISSMIFEDLITETAEIRTCPTTCNFNNLVFTEAGANATDSWEAKKSKWFLAANSALGPPTANDVRLISVNQPNNPTQCSILVTLHSRDGSSQNQFMRIINGS